MLSYWTARKSRIESDFAITAWALCIMPEVRADVAARMNGNHREAIERVIRKLYTNDARDIDIIINDFWKQFKHWRQKTGKYGDNEGRWHLPEVKAGTSHVWHENYSLPYYPELGHVACRTTSKIVGIGPAERGWGDVKRMKDGARACLSGAKTEKQAILYTTARLAEARLKRDAMEKIDAEGPESMWGDDDIRYVWLCNLLWNYFIGSHTTIFVITTGLTFS